MTELEFKNTNPTDYGQGNVNLLYSGSIGTGSYLLPSNKYGASGSFDYDLELITGTGKEYYLADALFPPYRILGLTIPFASNNDVQLEQTLAAVTEIKFTFGSAIATVKVSQVTKRTQYYYVRTQPVDVFTFPEAVDNSNTPYEVSVEFIFAPYLAAKFNNSDFNALIGNATDIVRNSVAVELDKAGDQMNPTNLAAVITQTATSATTQDSNYQVTGWTNARYYGSKNTSTIQGNDTALTYVSFKGSVHPKDSTTATILANVADSDTLDIYFDVARKPTSIVRSGSLGQPEPFVTASSYPIPFSGATALPGFAGNFLYQEQGNRFVKIVDKKIHATDKGTVFTTNELGRVVIEKS
jgi:hypothetical protein